MPSDGAGGDIDVEEGGDEGGEGVVRASNPFDRIRQDICEGDKKKETGPEVRTLTVNAGPEGDLGYPPEGSLVRLGRKGDNDQAGRRSEERNIRGKERGC